MSVLGSRGAFVRDSTGNGSSRANLGSLAGKRVRFRFRIGTSGWSDDYGWFIDDVRIYTCSMHAPTTVVTGPSRVTAGTSGTWTISARDAAPDDQAGFFRYTIDWNGDGRADASVSHGSSIRVYHAYRRAGHYTITVQVADHHGNARHPRNRIVVVRPATAPRA